MICRFGSFLLKQGGLEMKSSSEGSGVIVCERMG
jgi:hypothetical protein